MWGIRSNDLYWSCMQGRWDIAWIREEEHRESKYIKSLVVGPVVHFCELEKGVMLGEEDEEQDEDLIRSLENAIQHKERMLEASRGTQKSHVFTWKWPLGKAWIGLGFQGTPSWLMELKP